MRVSRSSSVRRLYCALSGFLLLLTENYSLLVYGKIRAPNHGNSNPAPGIDNAGKPRNLQDVGVFSATGGPMVQVILGFNANVDPARLVPPGSTILHQYTYVNAAVAQVPAESLPTLTQFGNFTKTPFQKWRLKPCLMEYP
jgi:hypothetical protein